MAKRRFRAYCVGMAKSGTTSMAGLFSKYRAEHEFMFPETAKAISDFRSGFVSKGKFIKFLQARDRLGNMEMDSASFHFTYLDILAEEYPDAKFIATIRDCYTWLDSVLNMLLLLEITDWMIDFLSRSFNIRITREMFRSREDILHALPAILDGVLGYWADGLRFTMDTLPKNRSLIIKTHAISDSLDEIADFLGIPVDSLSLEKCHLFKAADKFYILHDTDNLLLQRKFNAHCGPLMQKYFPESDFETFLENSKKEKSRTPPENISAQHPMKIGKHKIRTPAVGDYILQFIKNLHAEYGYECSFKFFYKNLLRHRFVVSLNKMHLKESQFGELFDIFNRIDMPKDFVEIFAKNLPSATAIGLGFEQDNTTCIYKVYLDFWEQWEKEMRGTPNHSKPFRLYMGFKWDAFDHARCALGQYTWYPSLSFESIRERISHVFNHVERPIEFSSELLGMVSSRVSRHQVKYLEVADVNSQRKSFDLNIYPANLLLKQLYPMLLRAYQHYSIHVEDFHELYNQIRKRKFGHLAGGMDREGRDFLTVYYGIERMTNTQ